MWTAYDTDAGWGEDYWDDVTCQVVTGWWSVWCSGYGDMPQCSYYDWDMYACMDMVWGIDLRDYEDITISFWLWYETEPTTDWIAFYTRQEGGDWEFVDYWQGNSYGWTQIEFPYDKDWCYLSFVFRSDTTAMTEDGVFIDDIMISGTPPPPNLTPCWPLGWDWPVVASGIPGTHWVTDLYGGETTFVDVAFENYSDVDCGQFAVGLYLDGALQHEWWNTGLVAWEIDYYEDYPLIVPTGSHNLEIRVDIYDSVEESDEDDNDWDIDYWWDPAEITYTGQLLYRYQSPSGWISDTLRDIKIEARDWDAGMSQLLATDWTDDQGRFTLGPFANNGDPTDLVNIADLTYFVAHFFGSGPAPPCWDEANINGDAHLNIVDLTFLVCHLFGSGCTPPACP